MADDIQTLGVVERLFPQILSKEKLSTIRWNERRIVPGPMRFVCDEDRRKTVDVEVIRCTDMPLSHTASFVGKSDEWPDIVMLEGMREHYPEIELSSIVQVVEYTLP
ncbi:MAG: ASCH domain-containing protein [Pseudoruegeria sp.]